MKKPRKSAAENQARLLASQSKPVKLRVAASVLHNDLTRQGRFSLRGPDYISALTKAAAMLASVVDVYYLAPGRKLLRIPDEELKDGSFEDGGNIFRAASGTLYRSLSVRRIDVMEGLEVLRQTRRTLDQAAADPDGVGTGGETETKT